MTQVLALAQWTLHSNAPSTALAFVYCLVWLFKFSDEALTRIYESEIYDKISRELSWILRHSGWTHADLSLTVFEQTAGARFRKMLSQWAFNLIVSPWKTLSFRLCKRPSCSHGVKPLSIE